jgi:hypothetical protein
MVKLSAGRALLGSVILMMWASVTLGTTCKIVEEIPIPQNRDV